MINQPKKEWNHHEEAKIHVEEPWSSWLIMLKQSTVKQPWSGKTTFYHQAFCNVAHFLFLAYWNFRFQTNRPSLISVRTWVDSPELETSCHAYVLNCILCINWHFAVLIYNLFILPRIWFHLSHGPMNLFHPMFFWVHVGSKMCVQENVEHIHQSAVELRQWLAVQRSRSAYLVGANGIDPTWAQLRGSY